MSVFEAHIHLLQNKTEQINSASSLIKLKKKMGK